MVIVDPHRVGHELSYYPGETNVRFADIIIVSKVNTAVPENVRLVKENVRKINPTAKIIDSNIVITAEDEDKLTAKDILIIEDGPTLTHGEMAFGAGIIAANTFEADTIIDPRSFAVGTIKDTFNHGSSEK